MKFLSMLLTFLDTKMEVPLLYGPFHIFIILMSVFAGFRISKHAGRDESCVRRFLLLASVTIEKAPA